MLDCKSRNEKCKNNCYLQYFLFRFDLKVFSPSKAKQKKLNGLFLNKCLRIGNCILLFVTENHDSSDIADVQVFIFNQYFSAQCSKRQILAEKYDGFYLVLEKSILETTFAACFSWLETSLNWCIVHFFAVLLTPVLDGFDQLLSSALSAV